MLTSIIIDRVGNTNVFNIVQESGVGNPALKANERLQSIIDDDLIGEYLDELGRIANISRSLSSLPRGTEENQALIFQHLNLSHKLREIGEALFKQFFPVPLQEFIRDSQQTYLYFHVDAALASLPLEILHDGSAFLWEKFYLGKAIKGQDISLSDFHPREIINMLIIADPREDLDWARREGELLFEHLGAFVSPKKINLTLIGGKTVTKLNILNSILDKDIIHYAGHLHYSGNPDENGWLLADGKILYAREFKMSGAQPKLIFCNSCLSARSDQHVSDASWYAQFAAAFIRAGRTSYVGTNWELPDRQPTLEFTTQFYDHIFQGKSLGESLQQSRSYAREHFSLNDLTWASYLLMGNPMQTVFRAESLLPDVTRNMLEPDDVMAHYPFPIAEAFEKFHKVFTEKSNKGENGGEETLKTLFYLYSQCVFFLTALILANYRVFNFPKPIAFPFPNVEKSLAALFSALGSIRAIKAHPLAVNLLETLYVHKENLEKLAVLRGKYRAGSVKDSDFETYTITVQYLLEALLIDLDFLRHYGFYLIVEPGHRQLSYQGVERNHSHRDILLPTQANAMNYSELLEKTSYLVGRCVFYSPVKKTFLDLSPFMRISANNDGSYAFAFTKTKALAGERVAK
ncbi:MAG: CHAT domain-containing protein [Leptospiraceae bacterium]|nr:CHAT domain-containing protein [Leptospiraceae bacterium]